MMNEEKEISFFKKLMTSIKDFEKYPDLASKRWGVVLSYLIKLLAIFTIIVSFTATYKIAKQIEEGLQYINKEIPEFTFENKILKVNAESPIIKENKDNLFDTIMIDTLDINHDTLENYKQTLQKVENGIVFLQDRILLKTSLTNEIVEYDYKTIAESYQIENFNKERLLQYFSGTNLNLIYIGIFIMMFIYMFLVYITSIWLDIILLAIFGSITAFMMRMRIRFSAMCKIAIHSLTLPILLSAIAILIETFTDFQIQYFEIMYIGIAYIYMVTAILMIKSDIIKNQKELAKIIEEQEKVRQELERKKQEEENEKEEQRRKKEKEKQRKKEKKEEKEKEKEKERNVGDEPQGENA